MRLLTVLFLFSTALGWEHAEWLNGVEKRLDEDAVAWLRKQINPNEERKYLPELSQECAPCHKGGVIDIAEPKLFVFMSFSVPENIWLSLSQEMANYQAVFVLRGLPNNSFKSFAQKIAQLKKQGLAASVQIHPQLFNEHSIERVPAFLFIDHSTTHQVAGAISLNYAIDLIGQEGENLKKFLQNAGEQES